MTKQANTNRWLPLIGGTLLNLVLGVFYSWSVFVLPLAVSYTHLTLPTIYSV